jgi:hypothetical protein
MGGGGGLREECDRHGVVINNEFRRNIGSDDFLSLGISNNEEYLERCIGEKLIEAANRSLEI